MRKAWNRGPDLTGKQFGEWLAWKEGPARKSKWGQKTTYYCTCKCGKVKLLLRDALVAGETTNCGCVSKPKMKRTENCQKPYTEEEDNAIRKWYPYSGSQFLTGYLGRSATAIRARAYHLRIQLKVKKKPNKNWWTDREDDVVKELYAEGGYLACLPFLPRRSKHAIRQRARILKVVCIAETSLRGKQEKQVAKG